MLRYITALVGVVHGKYLREGEEGVFLDLGATGGPELDVARDVQPKTCVEARLSAETVEVLLKNGLSQMESPISITDCKINGLECALPKPDAVMSTLDNFVVDHPGSIDVANDKFIVCSDSTGKIVVHIFKGSMHLECPSKDDFASFASAKEKALMIKPTRVVCEDASVALCQDSAYTKLASRAKVDIVADAKPGVMDMWTNSPAIAEQLQSTAGRSILIDSAVSSANIDSLVRVQPSGYGIPGLGGPNGLQRLGKSIPNELWLDPIEDVLKKGGGFLLMCPLYEAGPDLGSEPVPTSSAQGMALSKITTSSGDLASWLDDKLAGIGSEMLVEAGKTLELGWGDSSWTKTSIFSARKANFPTLSQVATQLSAFSTQRQRQNPYDAAAANEFEHLAELPADLVTSDMRELLLSANTDVDPLILTLFSSGESRLQEEAAISSKDGRVVMDFSRLAPREPSVVPFSATPANAEGKLNGDRVNFNFETGSRYLGKLAAANPQAPCGKNSAAFKLAEELYNKAAPGFFSVYGNGDVLATPVFVKTLAGIFNSDTPEICGFFPVADVLVCSDPDNSVNSIIYRLGSAGEGSKPAKMATGTFDLHNYSFTIDHAAHTYGAKSGGNIPWTGIKVTVHVSTGYKREADATPFRKVFIRTIQETGHVHLSASSTTDTSLSAIAISSAKFLPFHLYQSETVGSESVFSGPVSVSADPHGYMTVSLSSLDFVRHHGTFVPAWRFGDSSAIFGDIQDPDPANATNIGVAYYGSSTSIMPQCDKVATDAVMNYEEALKTSLTSLIPSQTGYSQAVGATAILEGSIIDLKLTTGNARSRGQVMRRTFFGNFGDSLKEHLGAVSVSAPQPGLKVPSGERINTNRMMLLLGPALESIRPERLTERMKDGIPIPLESNYKFHRRFPLQSRLSTELYQSVKFLESVNATGSRIELSAPHPSDGSTLLETLVTVDQGVLYGSFTGCGACLDPSDRSAVIIDVVGSSTSDLVKRRLNHETCFDAPEVKTVGMLLRNEAVDVGNVCEKIFKCAGEKGAVDQSLRKRCDGEEKKKGASDDLAKKIEDQQKDTISKIPPGLTEDQVKKLLDDHKSQSPPAPPAPPASTPTEGADKGDDSSCC